MIIPLASSLLLSTALILSIATSSSAFNITRLLDQYPDFAQFNSLLFQTRLSAEINRRRTITVLALSNDRMGELSGKSLDVAKRILSTHVILDYYDLLKLNKLKGNTTVVTTLYQASGIADDRQGFLRVGHRPDGIFFGSAVRGSPMDVQLVGSVASQPYNISVLSLTRAIIAPGIDGTWTPIEAPPPVAESPKEAPTADAPAADADADAPEADADAPVADADADAPALIDAPAPAPGSEASPADEDVADDELLPRWKNDGGKVGYGLPLGLIVGLVWLWI